MVDAWEFNLNPNATHLVTDVTASFSRHVLLCNSGLKYKTQDTQHVSVIPVTAQPLADGPLVDYQVQLGVAYNSHNIQQLFNETECIRQAQHIFYVENLNTATCFGL